MTTPYEKGRRVEYQLANELREQGWTVIRSAGSKGPADLVAWLGYNIAFIQVKRCRSKPELRRAVKVAIAKFDAAGVRPYSHMDFEVWLRYKGEWVRVWRGYTAWRTGPKNRDLLGQTEWPITEREE